MNSPAPDGTETEALLAQARAGKAEVFDQLFARHRPYLAKFVELRLDPRLRPRVNPSDVVQEAHLEAVRRLPEYMAGPPMPFRLWLRKITQDRLFKMHRYHLKAARRSIHREAVLPDSSSLLLAKHVLSREGQPGRRLEQEELARQLRAALAKLSKEDAEIMMMRAVEDLSHHEIGYLLGIEPAAARKRYSRALVRLHGLLSKET